jgi:hypothetical protein
VGPENPELRVSDQERERAAESIRQHYAAGRLDSEEFDTRVSAAYAARTQADLAVLHADLPPLGDGLVAAGVTAPVVRASEHWRRSLEPVVGSLGLFAFSNVVWALTGANSSYWPKWALILVAGSAIGAVKRWFSPADPQPEADS